MYCTTARLHRVQTQRQSQHCNLFEFNMQHFSMHLCVTVHGTKGHTLTRRPVRHIRHKGTERDEENEPTAVVSYYFTSMGTHRNYSECCQTLTVPPSTLCPLDSRVIAQLMSLAPAQTDWITAFLPQHRGRGSL